MLKILFKPQAVNDLEKIYEYTFSNWGLNQADKYQDEIYNHIQLVADRPDLGSLYERTPIKYIKTHVNKHLIFYRTDEMQCIVVRILHEKMDIGRHLK